MVFVDETGINLAMTQLYARALKGKKAVSERPNERGKNLTLVDAIALCGIVAAMTFSGGTERWAILLMSNKC